MPVHDWTGVFAGTCHRFHSSWITHPAEAFNGGVLPDEYYALVEQHAGAMIRDVPTLWRRMERIGSRKLFGGDRRRPALPETPLFLTTGHYVLTPFVDPSYMAAYRGLPSIVRDVVEGRLPPEGEEQRP
ncbi:MAG TPA: hypothetical protein EYP56_07240 [Planctomycetaceae bacterium]|nr:hypothetical protein [Planctomycetaceae bacterium]